VNPATDATPYRTEALAIVREVSICSWCKHQTAIDWHCHAHTKSRRDFVRSGHKLTHHGWADCSTHNDHGECEKFEPSRLTRVLRFLHIGRAPETREA
jgi:hypothetical protein